MVPAFAIGRVEEVLYWLKQLEDAHAIPEVPVFLDSPMAVEALQFYVSRNLELDDEFRQAARPLAQFLTRRFQAVPSTEASLALAASSEPSIVISSSGMATGGRVMNHLERVLPDPRNTVLFVGYQAAGTRGRSLIDGAKQSRCAARTSRWRRTSIGLIRCPRTPTVARSSAGCGDSRSRPGLTCIVHGELPAMEALDADIAREFGPGWRTRMPDYLESLDL